MTLVQIHVGQMQLQWRADRSATSKRWVAVCEPIGLVTEADTLDELYSTIDEAVQLLMTDLLRGNELDAFLRERGWRAGNIPVSGRPEEIKFDVPWELIASGRDPERRAH